jgi:hypothetical protein
MLNHNHSFMLLIDQWCLLAEYADADQAWLLLEAWLNWLEIF